MKTEIKYQIPMFSWCLESDPDLKFEGMDVKMIIEGYGENDVLYETEIKFISVIGFKTTITSFARELYDAHDNIIEVIDSEWLKEFKIINPEEFSYWKPKHYALFLQDSGMYQFLAESFEVVNRD